MKNKREHKTNVQYIYLIYTTIAAGIIDALYVSYLHVSNYLPFYTLGRFFDCGYVLRSPYSSPLGIPLAFLGSIHFVLVLWFFWKSLSTDDTKWKRLLFLQTALGIIASLYELYLQLVLIRAVCGYVSLAIIFCVMLYVLVRKQFSDEHKQFRADKQEFIKKLLSRKNKPKSEKKSPPSRLRART